MLNFGGLRFKIFQLVVFLLDHIPSVKRDYWDLVIVRVDNIGDYVMWHDSIVAYKKTYSGKRVLFICPHLIKELAEKESFFDSVIDVNTKRISKDFQYFFSFFKVLRSIKAYTVIYPVWERHIIGDYILKVISAKEKIGLVGVGRQDLWWSYYNKTYTKLLNNPDTENEIESIEYFTKNAINIDYRYGGYPLFPSIVEEENRSDYVVIAISSSVAQKIWEMDKFAYVIDSIPDKYKVFLCGSGVDDQVRAETILSIVKNKDRVNNLINKTTIVELAEVISKAYLVIGNDSAAVHMAAATHTPSIAIMHGAHFGRFLPYPKGHLNQRYNPIPVFHSMDCYRCGYHCLYKFEATGPYECLRKVTVNDVIVKLKKFF